MFEQADVLARRLDAGVGDVAERAAGVERVGALAHRAGRPEVPVPRDRPEKRRIVDSSSALTTP